MSARAVRRSLTGAVIAALVWALVPSATGAPPVCSRSGPEGLKFERKRGLRYGRLTWPSRGKRMSYRVFRNGVVIGQTKRRAMPVRVKPGRLYSFAVRVVRTSGVMANCVGELKQRVRWFPPARTRKPVVRRTGEASVRLRWRPAKRGDGRLAGYRVYRNGRVHRQVRRRSARLRLPTGATYRIQVAGLDTHGRVGVRSRAVFVRIGHRPPGPAGDISVGRVSDTEVELAWRGSAGGSARVVGYRVYRNGVPVRQVPGNSTVVGNLAPVTQYGFSIAPVDSRGYLGPVSGPVSVTTAYPPPSDGKVHAFLLASTDASFEDLQRNYRKIGTLYPTYLQCVRGTGVVHGADDPLVTSWAKLRRIRVMPRFNCQHGPTLHTLFTDAVARERSIGALIALARQHDWAGINLDFEAGFASDKDGFTDYANRLGRRLRAEGRKLSLEVSAKWDSFITSRNSFYDYRGLQVAADHVFVMNWGFHYSQSGPGSPDPLPSVREAANYTASMPNKRKFVLGSPLYGMDWAAGGGQANPGVALEYADVMALVARTGARPRLDATQQSWHFRYTDGRGVGHDVWFNDRTTIAMRMKIARDRGLGFGVWRLGSEDQGVWDAPILAPANWP